MQLTAKQVLLISRPRFWMYVLGTFLVGMVAAGNPLDFEAPTVLLLVSFGLFFSLPANLLIYGVNDIFDYDTDIYNVKKVKYEQLLSPTTHSRLWMIIAVACLPFLPLLFVSNEANVVTLVVFLIAGFFYSAPPIRAKTKPPFDVISSAIIYVSPALIGYFATGRTDIEWLAVAGGLIWAFGMQTYSAVPDIDADQKAGEETIATYLGKRRSLLFCLTAYLGATIIGIYYIGIVAAILGSVYITMIVLSLVNSGRLFRYYTYFPYINVGAGAVIFFYLFSKMIL